MNAVEIETAISDLAAQPFDATEFPFQFLQAFGSRETTLRRLRKGDTNASDIPGGLLQRNNIHIGVCGTGQVHETLLKLRRSQKTEQLKARFVLATDGETVEAEELSSGETVACQYTDFPQKLGFFLPLAGISTIREIKDNPIDVRATSRLNKLYIELLRENPEWAAEARRHDMNHFMARLIFCFFAEDTDIFMGGGLFTQTVQQWSARDASNTDYVISTVFRAMNTKTADRATASLPNWACGFPYVNGGLFSGSTEVPRFTKMARTYLIHAGELSWREINPDIFGSMIQAVAEDEERGELGMHYTSVPNILKVLNPLFLDDLRAQLESAGTNGRVLLNLRKRLSLIRVFDPACGSGNFLVIAYKEMRAIEAEINSRRGEPDIRSEIRLTNFRGIELRDFPAEIARLALIIAEFQCDVRYRGQKTALLEFLPLDKQNWITCGNALRLDWLSVCPSTGSAVKLVADDLFGTPLDQAQIDFENEGGETYVCGNPPYKGSQRQSEEQKEDLRGVFGSRTPKWKSLDYVAGWFYKAADYGSKTRSATAFVSTNSVCQGRQVETLWTLVFAAGQKICFAHTSFKWSNLARGGAGVTVVIIGIAANAPRARLLFSQGEGDQLVVRETDNINGYLIAGPEVVVQPQMAALCGVAPMSFGSMPNDGGHLLLSLNDARIAAENGVPRDMIRPFLGSHELIRGGERRCIWVTDGKRSSEAESIPWLRARFEMVRSCRLKSDRATTQELAARPYRFGEVRQTGEEQVIIVPSVSSESRAYLPVGIRASGAIVSNLAFALFDAPLWNLALIASTLHLVWIATVCGKLETRYRYSNTLGWNTFPLPTLTDQNKADLTECAENILIAREQHFPATIADLYDPDNMPDNLRAAHDQNDETLERIYIGRRFRNDTERLEKLFELYQKVTSQQSGKGQKRKLAL